MMLNFSHSVEGNFVMPTEISNHLIACLFVDILKFLYLNIISVFYKAETMKTIHVFLALKPTNICKMYSCLASWSYFIRQPLSLAKQTIVKTKAMYKTKESEFTLYHHFVTHTMLKKMFYPTHTIIIAMDAFLGLVPVKQQC